MHFYLKEYNVINNNYKKLENLAKIDLTYKQNQLYELRDKHVSLDVGTCCNLCGKKIVNNTQLMIYPNGHIYHAKCSPDEHLEIKTGKNFKNLFEVQIFETVYNKFRKEFEKREEGMEQPNFETNDNTNDTNDKKVKLESNNNVQTTKKKRRCC